MANIGEMSGPKQWAALLLGAVVLTAALYFTVFKTQREANAASQQKLDTKLRENAELEAYRPKLAEIERQLASLKQQLEIERRIVPDEKEVDGFMRMLSGEARKSRSGATRRCRWLRKSFIRKSRSKWNWTARITRCSASSIAWASWSGS